MNAVQLTYNQDFEEEVRESIIKTVANAFKNVRDGDEMLALFDTANFRSDKVITTMFQTYFKECDEAQASYIIYSVRNDLISIQDYLQEADQVEPQNIEAYI